MSDAIYPYAVNISIEEKYLDSVIFTELDMPKLSNWGYQNKRWEDGQVKGVERKP